MHELSFRCFGFEVRFLNQLVKGLSRWREAGVFVAKQRHFAFHHRPRQGDFAHMRAITLEQGGRGQNSAANTGGDQVDGRGMVLNFVVAVEPNAVLGQLVVHEHPRGHEVAHHNQVGLAHIRPSDRVFALQRVRVAADEHQGVVKQWCFNQVWMRFAIHRNADFGLMVEHRLAHFVRGRIQQTDAVAGADIGILTNELGQHVSGHAGHAGEGEVAFGVLRHVFEATYGGGHLIHDGAGLGQKIATNRSHLDTPRGAVKQFQAQIGFEFLHAARQCGLRDVQLFSGFVEAPEFGGHHEGLNAIKVNFHGSIVNQGGLSIFVKVGSENGRFAGYNNSFGA